MAFKDRWIEMITYTGCGKKVAP